MTPMQELSKHIVKIGKKQHPLSTLQLIVELLEKEKQMIIDLVYQSLVHSMAPICIGDNEHLRDLAEQYYNERFKK